MRKIKYKTIFNLEFHQFTAFGIPYKKSIVDKSCYYEYEQSLCAYARKQSDNQANNIF